MELIVTHVGADFDALASSLVARRLHPGARLFFPGSREESVRRFLDGRGEELDELRQRQVDPAEITRIVLCDARQRDRLGIVPQWLAEHPGIEVLAYDHHSDGEDDVPAAGGRVDPTVGATCTLIAEELRERGEEPTGEEATLLLMGIYEDTGSLTYPTTHGRDLAAVAWLLERGGDLAEVRRWAVHSLDRDHLEILYRMTRMLEVHPVRGHRVGVVALELGRFVEELAPLVSRCLEIFELPLLFGLFGEDERVTVIARGDVEAVDLGEVLEGFAGGGGHRTAAAGSVKGATALEVRERLLTFLASDLPLTGVAADLMVRRYVAVEHSATVAGAKDRLLRTRVNAAPVLDGTAAVGAVTRQLLDAALQHDLGERSVTAVMEPPPSFYAPDRPIDRLAREMVRKNLRFVLVGEPGSAPLGLVTRTMALHAAYGALDEVEEPFARRARESRPRRQGLQRRIEEAVPGEVRARLELVAATSRQRSQRAYVVGGFVRDLLLERDNRDLDVVVEGDGPALARDLAAAAEGRVRVHEEFLTAVVTFPDGGRVDVATARTEFYRAPAALPEVTTSALRQDLFRRDFTINTLALRLGPEPGYELIDHFGGGRDLEEGMLRVLHSLSFIDDPTRVLRAVRLELRLGLRISPETLRLIDVALAEGVFAQLSGSRLREELFLLLEDPATAVRGLERLHELGLLGVLDPDLGLDADVVQRLREARAVVDWYRLQSLDDPPLRPALLQLFALVLGLPREARWRLGDRLDLPQGERERIVRLAEVVGEMVERLARRDLRPHEVRETLARAPGEEVLLAMAVGTAPVRAWVRRDLEELRRLTLGVRGADLLAAGATPGPAIGEALRATLEARLDGEIGPAEELAFARAQLPEIPPG